MGSAGSSDLLTVSGSVRKVSFQKKTVVGPSLWSAHRQPRRLPFVGILLNLPLHLGIELHAEPVGEAVHEVESTGDEHDIHHLFLTETALFERVEVRAFNR